MKVRATISMRVLFAVLPVLCAVELACGTNPLFVALMAGTLICITITYNALGGLGTISGILFASLGVRTIVISQFAKALLLQAADKNLDAPLLTIGVYQVFFLSAMIGVLTFGKLRLKLPKPLEVGEGRQTDLVIFASMAVGLFATLQMEIGNHNQSSQTTAGNAALIFLFSGLSVFALVMAVNSRITQTDGAHSFGIQAFIPWAALTLMGFVATSRSSVVGPSLAYLVACYARGYRFRRMHAFAVLGGIAFFYAVISPVQLYSRSQVGQATYREQIDHAVSMLSDPPSWSTVKRLGLQAGQDVPSREDYFDVPGTFVLSRLSLIRSDSNMMSVCSSGFHYGWTVARIEILLSIPRIFHQERPATGPAAYTGRLTGLNSDSDENAQIVLSPVADAFGSFGWLSVSLFPMVVFPLAFVMLDSMFNLESTWGMVALGLVLGKFAEMSLLGYLLLSVRLFILIQIMSYAVVGVARMVPTKDEA